MKLMTSLVTVAALLAPVALATPVVTTVSVETHGVDVAAAGSWSTVCVGNLRLETAVAAQYKYGTSESAEWKDIEVKPNHIVIFQQRHPGVDPLPLAVRFAPVEDAEPAEVALAQTQTIFRQGGCSRVENYRFEASEDGVLSLVRVN